MKVDIWCYFLYFWCNYCTFVVIFDIYHEIRSSVLLGLKWCNVFIQVCSPLKKDVNHLTISCSSFMWASHFSTHMICLKLLYVSVSSPLHLRHIVHFISSNCAVSTIDCMNTCVLFLTTSEDKACSVAQTSNTSEPFFSSPRKITLYTQVAVT